MLEFALNHVCYVERGLAGYALYFDLFVIVATALFLYFFSHINKKYLHHYFSVMMGVLIFEMFTSPMWNNPHFGKLAYVYQDVSWVLAIGWTTLILSVVLLVDTLFAQYRESIRFFLYMLGMAVFGFVAEAVVVNFGLRTYSEEVLAVLWGPRIWNVPVEVFYYIPVFTALIIGFYKYWASVLDNAAVIPERKVRWVRSFGLTAVAVILFELMVEPMAINSNLPEWSYIYNDISILMTGGWIFVIWLATKLVDKYFVQLNLKQRFGLYMLTGGLLSVFIEGFYVANGFRSYSESAIRDFVGLHTPLTNLPIEILFAMPMYVALMIGFLRYWEFILSKGYMNKVVKV